MFLEVPYGQAEGDVPPAGGVAALTLTSGPRMLQRLWAGV